MNEDDFKDHPVSVAERRSDKSEDAKDWTPRDLLIHMLRGIDSGTIKAETLLVCFRWKDDEGHEHCSFRQASPSTCISLGLMEIIKQRMFA